MYRLLSVGAGPLLYSLSATLRRWVLHLEPDYSAALVGSPDGKYLWILAREEQPGDAVIGRILEKAEALGYQTEPLEFAQQVTR